MKTKLQCMWAILRGREIAYRIEVHGGIVMRGPKARIVQCIVRGDRAPVDFGVYLAHPSTGSRPDEA